MKNELFVEYLREIHACSEARNWVVEHKGNSNALWRDCERGDWMAWLCVKAQDRLGITRQQIVLALCDCAELSLHFFEEKYPEDKRPRQALEVARRWAAGNASEEDVRKAGGVGAFYAAGAYAAGAYAAAAAAYAAYAAAAYAADATAARKETLKKCADIFRKHFPKLKLN